MFSRLQEYKGRVDRDAERGRGKDRIQQDISPRSDLEKAISDSKDVIMNSMKTKVLLTADEAFSLYMSGRAFRHDIWLDFLNRCKTSREYKFMDTKVSEFYQSMSQIRHLEPINPNLLRLTPDILFYDSSQRCIYIGDITCTRSMKDADRRKYLKYKDIADFFRENHFTVKHKNFIIEENLNNVNHMINEFVHVGIIYDMNEIRSRTIFYHRLAQEVINDSIEYCNDRSGVRNLIKVEDRMVDSTYDTIEVPNNITLSDIIIEEPTVSMLDIGLMVKAEVDAMPEDYFDNSIAKVKLAINKLKVINNEREHMEPKSTLKVCHNSHDLEDLTDYDLINNYLADVHCSDEKDKVDYLTWMLPSSTQLKKMKDIKRGIAKPKDFNDVYGPYQYNIPRGSTDNFIINNTLTHLSFGKKKNNVKKSPKTISPERYIELFSKTEDTIMHLGSQSLKPAFLDDTWDIKNNLESDTTNEMRVLYNQIKRTNGVQLGNSLSNLYQRLCHLKTSLSTKDNIYTPPNGSFICIIPKDHAPVTSAKCDVPMIFITRAKTDGRKFQEISSSNEYEYSITGEDYTYFISKLCRLSISKLANWDQAGYKICATSTYIASLNRAVDYRRVVGILTMMSLDVHQKTSEFLDLLKYVAFMPFSDISRLASLIEDKFNIMVKTSLDVWTMQTIEHLMLEVSDHSKLNASKPKIQLHNGLLTHESLGMSLSLPSIFDISKRHTDPCNYIEDIAMIFTSRGKQLYGSQFMDASITKTAEWEDMYQKEILAHGNWVVDGAGEGQFPFNSEFAFHKDAILHAKKIYNEKFGIDKGKVMRTLVRGSYGDFLHYNCSLRGCVKEPEDRKNPSDLHTTSMESCLNHYEKIEYDSNLATSNSVAYDFIKSGKRMEFSMSEKEQRGGGRPIATPTLGTKAALMMLEKPEAAMGEQYPNNIVVPGKNKLQELCEAYKKLVSKATIEGFKMIFQLTEDQTKFSEMDNLRKYEPLIANNPNLDPIVRQIQSTVLKKLMNRVHLVKRMPKHISDTELSKTMNEQGNGVVTHIGWPQGMINCLATTAHCEADIFITDLYNLVYPKKVKTIGLGHSDDSWVAVACDSLEEFTQFCKFRIKAKKLFCLKINEKKLWGSRYLGELVSNYNLNGNVHLSISKTISNSFNNLTYQNWTLDVHSQVSTLQQCYRNGCDIPTLTLMSTILRQQILNSYQIKGKQLELLSLLPIELGGYPNSSVFELGVNGVNSHYYFILDHIRRNPTSDVAKIVLRCLRLSMLKIKKMEDDIAEEIKTIARTKISSDLLENEESNSEYDKYDFSVIRLPYRGDVFCCVQHIMPQSTKVKKTVTRLKNLPFESDGLELLVTKPLELKDALGHLREQTSTILYRLASERYTQSARRLAVSQSLQSSGKTVKIYGFKPMTINTLLEVFLKMDNIVPACLEQLEVAFTDSNPVPQICVGIIYNSESQQSNNDKRKIINRLPEIDNNYKTMIPLKDILLYIVDRSCRTTYFDDYANKSNSLTLVHQEAEIIMKRFKQYFQCYTVKVACNLIMRLSMDSNKTRLWMQPYLNQETMTTFLEDLYGKTLDSSINYRIKSNISEGFVQNIDIELIDSIYTVSVLNKIYPGKFKISHIDNEPLDVIMSNIDTAKLPIDSFLKFSVIMSDSFRNNHYLALYDDIKMYSKKFIKSQEYVDGHYQGKMVVLVKYGATCLKITGEPGDITLETNNLVVNDVLMAMMLFVNDCFPSDRYHHPNQWYNSPMWKTKYNIGNFFLTAYTQTVTTFTKTSTGMSLAINHNPNLRFDSLYIVRERMDYILEQNLRVVSKIKDDAKVRVGNIKQSLRCPRAKNIHCYEELIDGIINNRLLHTKVIINMTLKRPYANSKKDMIELIESSDLFDDRILVSMYSNILNKFSTDISPRDIAFLQPLEIIEDYEIHGITSAKYLDDYSKTEAADLTHIETNLMLEDVEVFNAIAKYSNILKYLTQCIFITESKNDLDSIIKMVINDRFLKTRILDDIKSTDTEEVLDVLMEIKTKLCPTEVLCFIVANDLESKAGWDKINLRDMILRTNLNNNTSLQCHKIANKLLENLSRIISEQSVDDVNELLLGNLRE